MNLFRHRECLFSPWNILRVTLLFLHIVRLTKTDTLEDMTNDKKYNSYLEAENEDYELDPNEVPESDSEQRIVDWAYSPVDLMQLTKFEEDLYNEFGAQTMKQKHYFETASKGSEFVEIHGWWIQNYKESTLKATQNLPHATRITATFSHPFLTFRMMKRFTRLSEFLKGRTDIFVEPNLTDTQNPEQSGLNLTPEFFKKVKTFDARIRLPIYTDVKSVMKSIINIQFLYDFEIDELIRGRFGDTETNFGISLEEAFELGLFAHKLHMFPESLDWLHYVYTRTSQNPQASLLTNGTVLGLIMKVTKQHDDLIDSIAEDKRYDIYHRFTHKITSKNKLITRKGEDKLKFLASNDPLIRNYFPAYSYLCSGQDIITEEKRAKLICWYERKLDPAWVINPLKIEVHSWDPFLIQLYDVFGDKMIDFFLQTAMPNMERASTISGNAKDTRKSYVTMFRTSTSTALVEEDKEDGKIIQPLDRQVGKLVQLAVSNPEDPYFTASEQWQISAYAFGGEFAPHVDALEGKDDFDALQTGDRIATFMVYLNNVRRGGYTVFPHLGVSVVPRKGSALFWYDLYKNGTIDKRTLHGGCPVILGQKWITTKWIRHGANFRKRPCSLNAFE